MFVFSGDFDYVDLFSGSVQEGRKVKVIPGVKKENKGEQVGHSSHILALAISTDNKFLVSTDWFHFYLFCW